MTPRAIQSSRIEAKSPAFPRPSTSACSVWTSVPRGAEAKKLRCVSSEASDGQESVSSSVGSVVGISSVRKVRPRARGIERGAAAGVGGKEKPALLLRLQRPL